MNLKQLKNFIVVAEELNFSKAAKRLFISQPALSFDIKKLEEDLGVQLFIRNNKKVLLSKAGYVLLNEARHLLEQVKLTKQLTQQAAVGPYRYMTIGVVDSLLNKHFCEVVDKIEETYQLEIILKEMGSAEQVKSVASQQIDLGFAYWGGFPEYFQVTCLITEPFLCCVAPSHPLANKKEVDLKDLIKEHFIMFSRNVSPHYHDLIVSACIGADFTPYISHESRLWQTIIQMVTLERGIALIPQSICLPYQPHIKCISVKNINVYSKCYALYLKSEHDEVIKHFINMLKGNTF